MDKLTLTQPDDWHLHVRNGAILKTVIAHTAKQFARAIIMPNLKEPILTVDQALNYRQEILQALPEGSTFSPLMTLYLTPALTRDEIKKAAESKHIHAIKLYPAGATTNSDSGVSDLNAIYPILEAMEEYDLPLLIHGEVTNNDCDIFDREKEFVESSLSNIVKQFTNLRIVVEHVTTSEAVNFVLSSSDKVAATITPQHLMYNRNAILAGGIHPHHYCLPIIKREKHRLALVKAATSGNPKFFLGTDSAPHLTGAKETSCGCAGCYSAWSAIELYAKIFDDLDIIDKLEGFASHYGPDFYGLARNTDTITLQRAPWTIPEEIILPNGSPIVPFYAGEEINWRLKNS